MELAPIALFVYNRPEHTEQMLNSLLCNKLVENSIIYVFSDGPKSSTNNQLVGQVRTLVKQKLANLNYFLIERETNLGLTNSIIMGVNSIFEKHDSIIVLEDDLLVSSNFLEYMNWYLNKFAFNNDVIQINGYMFGNLSINEINAPFKMNWVSTWGWGTWKSKWQLVRFNKLNMYERLKLLFQKSSFNLDGSYDYYTMKLKKDKGLIQSWGIDLWYFAYKNKMQSIFPPNSLVTNIGFDGSGTNKGKKNTSIRNEYLTVELLEASSIFEKDEIKIEISKKLKNNELVFG